MLFDKVQVWGIILKIRRLHSWLLLLPFILFVAIFIIMGLFLGFHDKMIYKFSYAYASNHNETDSKVDDGPRSKITQCPPICNSSNMSNVEFFDKLRLRELLDPGPVKIPIDEIPQAPQKHQGSERRASHVIPTVQGPPYVAYKIGGHLCYAPRGKPCSRINFLTPTPPIPYTGVDGEDKNKWYKIKGKRVRASSDSLWERIKRSNPPWCLWSKDKRQKHIEME